MSTKREAIVVYVLAQLNTITATTGRVYRSRQAAFGREESPSILLELGRDSANIQQVSTCYIDWTLDVLIRVYVRGDVPDSTADSIISSIHTKLMTDRSMGGLVMDCYPVTHDPQMDNADLNAGWFLEQFQVRYRSALTTIEAIGTESVPVD